MNIVAIVNPRSASGRTARTWANIRRHLPHSVETLETSAPGHAIALTANAIRAGAEAIIAVGGDGTINEVVNGFFHEERPIGRDVTFGIIPHGTSSDFRRILNLPEDPDKAALIIRDGVAKPADLMKVRYARMDGTKAVRYSVNVTSFGMGGAVALRANRSLKPWGGRLAFLTATIRTALTFPGVSTRLILDGFRTIETRITNVAVGNGQYHGAGMWVCPLASINDGMLDVTVIRYLSVIEIARGLPFLYNGRLYEHPKVEFHRVRHVSAESAEPALIEIDGEPLGKLPLDISILPAALQVLTPP